MRLLFAQGENFDNYKQVTQDYKNAIETRKQHKEKLYQEIKIIKKLRV